MCNDGMTLTDTDTEKLTVGVMNDLVPIPEVR